MKQKNIEYNTFTDTDKMISLGIKAAPLLELEDGSRLDFSAAVKWVNAQ